MENADGQKKNPPSVDRIAASRSRTESSSEGTLSIKDQRNAQEHQPFQFKDFVDHNPTPSPLKSVNRTGLPDGLKGGIEQLSGISLDDVKVHYNSSAPLQLKALAYARGSQIHLAPGQEKHLPHEAWHVVQQKQGRVRPTLQLKDKRPVNDSPYLEREADEMGAKALQTGLNGQKVTSKSQSVSGEGVIQGRGFRLVNEKAPEALERGSTEEEIAEAGNTVWDGAFEGDLIDREGGVIAFFAPAEKEIEAEATTAREETIPNEAFAKVDLAGNPRMGTTIERWSVKDVPSEESGELVFPPGMVEAREGLIKEIIATSLAGGEVDEDAEPDTTEFDSASDFMMMMKPAANWCADNEGRRQEVINKAYAYLLAMMTARHGVFTKSVCDNMNGDDDDPFSTKLYDGLVQGLGLTGKMERKVVPTAVPLTLDEIILHEFGHIQAALITRKDVIASTVEGFRPNLASAVELAKRLSAGVSEGPPARAELGHLRFAWAQNVTNWYKIRGHPSFDLTRVEITEALKTMQNILMAFEEYMNIMDIDNRKVPASERGMRIRHGTDVATGLDMGVDLRPTESGLANKGDNQDVAPHVMADRVWRDKLKILLGTFIAKYEKD